MNKKYMYATSAALLVLVFAAGIQSAAAGPIEDCTTKLKLCQKDAPSLFYAFKRKRALEECTANVGSCLDDAIQHLSNDRDCTNWVTACKQNAPSALYPSQRTKRILECSNKVKECREEVALKSQPKTTPKVPNKTGHDDHDDHNGHDDD
jgi:hypothetical protein